MKLPVGNLHGDVLDSAGVKQGQSSADDPPRLEARKVVSEKATSVHRHCALFFRQSKTAHMYDIDR